MSMTILRGEDITKPHAEEENLPVIIVHCCNDIPVMGAGVAKALYEKWPKVKREYLNWGKGISRYSLYISAYFALGQFQLVEVEEDIIVCNLVGQHGIRKKGGIPPIRYTQFNFALDRLEEYLSERPQKFDYEGATIHIPYLIGCDLAGGEWYMIKRMFEAIFPHRRIYAYDKFHKSPEGE